MPLYSQRNSQKGQILLIVVLASVISLTVGLAAISRSITNTRLSTEEANSQKALAAAEAGVEEQLNKAVTGNTDPTSIGNIGNNSGFNASADPVDGTQIVLNNAHPVSRDEGADIWLSDYPDFEDPLTTSLTILWNNTVDGDSCSSPAIEVAVVYGADKNNPGMRRYAVDPCSTRGNGLDAPSGGGSVTYQGKNYSFTHSLVIPAAEIPSGRIARVIPIYHDSVIGVLSSQSLPAQGYVVNSTGTSGTTVRQVRVFQGFPRLPVEFFPYNLFLP